MASPGIVQEEKLKDSPADVYFLQGARGFPGTPGLPGIKGHRVSLEGHFVERYMLQSLLWLS